MAKGRRTAELSAIGMSKSQAMHEPIRDPVALARLHSLLRFSVGTTSAFVASEAMGAYPTFLAPLLAGVFLANLPGALPFKAGIALIAVQAIGAYGAYLLTTYLHGAPVVLFGAIGLVILVSFANLAQSRGFLPLLLILIAFSTIPIVTMIAPQDGVALPYAFTRGMSLAVITVWLVHVVWPIPPKPAAPSPKPFNPDPIALALTGTAIVLPLMLVYLMFGITDALPVLITTIVLVINFDSRRGAAQGGAMMIGNFVGGIIALSAHALLQIAPSLATLSLILFIAALIFAAPIERGGAGGAVGLITFNQAMVILSLSLMPGSGDSGLWMARLVQFGMACAFAIGMMSLLFPRLTNQASLD